MKIVRFLARRLLLIGPLLLLILFLTFMLIRIGEQDPVLGPPAMQHLRSLIHGCPEPLLIAQAGHFVQEHGEPIARAAVGYFSA